MAARGCWAWTVAALVATAGGCGTAAGPEPSADAAVGAETAGGDGVGEASDAAGADLDGSDGSGTTDGDGGGGQDAAGACPAATGERPSRRSEQVGAYDAKADKLVMFGGSFGVPENCGFPTPTFETETWTYDATCDLWARSKATGPAGRVRAAAAYVDKLGQTLVFGGRRREGTSGNYTLLKDLWAYDAGKDAWSQLSDGAGMSARFNHAMVWAKELDALLVFGGNTSASGLQYTATNDVWSYPLADGAWGKVAATGTAPAKRFFAGGLWDGKRKRLVVFGGADETLFADTAKYKNDLWALDFSADPPQWKALDAGSSAKPDARFWGEIGLDAAGDRYVLFGGHDDKALGNRNDLWLFSPEAGQWTQVVVGDAMNKPANGFCSFPPDFTKMEENTPERRNGGLVTSGGGFVWIAGGKTDCGVIDDLWRFDLKALAFDQRTAATVGEACVRKGGLTCNDYCF